MDNQTRRYLSEDWDDLRELALEKREEKRPPKPQAVDRRQAEKAWGKAHAKYWRERHKVEGKRK